MRPQRADPVVFVGPSLERDRVRLMLPHARIEPPIARGDLERLSEDGARLFLIIDGVFAHQLAVSPSEVVAAARGGANVVGAASMGAIRAAECWPAGVLGIGSVYSLYRMRVISNDDEVAVATDPERQFAALSVALLSVRYLALAALRKGLLTRASMHAVVAAAKRIHFSERRWETIFESAGVRLAPILRELCDLTDVKRRDALQAVERLAGFAPGEPSVPPGVGAVSARPIEWHSGRERYGGHDRHLGYPVPTVRRQLTRWLLGSGRYRRYCRASLQVADLEIASAEIWSMLARTGELEAELMRWYAVRRAGELNRGQLDASTLGRAQLGIASEHGFETWEDLVANVKDEELGRIPLTWIDDACTGVALARRNLPAIETPVSSRVLCRQFDR